MKRLGLPELFPDERPLTSMERDRIEEIVNKAWESACLYASELAIKNNRPTEFREFIPRYAVCRNHVPNKNMAIPGFENPWGMDFCTSDVSGKQDCYSCNAFEAYR